MSSTTKTNKMQHKAVYETHQRKYFDICLLNIAIGKKNTIDKKHQIAAFSPFPISLKYI